MKMKSFIFGVVGLLGSVAIAPTVCPAEDSNRFSFPLPSSLQSLSHRAVASNNVQVDAVPASGQCQLRVQLAQTKLEATRSDSLSEQMEEFASSTLQSVQAQAESEDSLTVESSTIRVVKKLGAGVLGGSFGTLVVFIIGENSNPDPIASVAAGPRIALLGYTFGSPLGVSWVDSRDKGVLTWAGSMAGWFVGRMALESDTSWPFAPLIGATIGSELWRKPPQDSQNSRVSVSLGPVLNGSLSAIVKLRF